MIRNLVGWIRSESRVGRSERKWAKWIGRNWARVSYAYRIEPTWLELNAAEVCIRNLPTAFSEFRIVQLSDFHASRQVTPEYLSEAVSLAQAQHPDLVVLTGDFIHRGYKYVAPVADALARLHAPCGVFAVLGNHDFSVRNALGFRRYRHLHHAVAQALSHRGIRVLRNESVTLQKEGASLYLVGLEDLWSRVCDLDRAFTELANDTPAIVLAHNPRTVEMLDGQRCDLMLSGHTHGGQIHLPRLGGRLGRPMLSRRARRFAAGMYRHRDTQIYVNKGVGFGFRFRFGVRPEVALLVLQRA